MTELNIHYCGQTVVPNLDYIGKTLTFLSLNYNLIQEINAEDFSECEVLETLEMLGNKLTIVPDLWTLSKTLRTLNLCQNDIKSFDDLLSMAALEMVIMTDNALEVVDMTRMFEMFPNLASLDVSRNQIKTLKRFNKTMCDRAFMKQYWRMVSKVHALVNGQHHT